MEKPRQLLVLGGMMAGMAYLGYAHDDPTAEGNTRAAFVAVAAVFLTHCFLQVGRYVCMFRVYLCAYVVCSVCGFGAGMIALTGWGGRDDLIIHSPPPLAPTHPNQSHQCRDTVIIRPHPGLWRVVHGLGMLYLMCLAVLLVHDKAGAR